MLASGFRRDLCDLVVKTDALAAIWRSKHVLVMEAVAICENGFGRLVNMRCSFILLIGSGVSRTDHCDAFAPDVFLLSAKGRSARLTARQKQSGNDCKRSLSTPVQ